MECKLEDIADVTMGQSPKSEFYNSDGEGIPFLQGNRTFGRRFPTFDTFTTKITKRASAGDVIMSVRAPVGDLNITPVDMCLGRGVCGIRMKNGKQDFLFYLMKYNMQQLLNKEAGTVFGSVNRNDINGLVVDIPDEETQDKIASFLGQIDRKIENNEAINRNLYEQCKITYADMFEGGDWDETVLEECTDQILRGKSGEYVEKSKYANLNQKVNKGFILEKQYYKYLDETIEIPAEKFGRSKDIILNSLGQGTLGRVHFLFDVEPNVVIDQHITIIRTNEKMTPEYLYFMLASDRYQDTINNSISGSTGMLMLNISVVRKLKVAVPPKELQEKFTELVEPMYAMIEKHNFENEQLANLRDSLLPRLMSGELDVSDLDI